MTDIQRHACNTRLTDVLYKRTVKTKGNSKKDNGTRTPLSN